MTSEADDEWKVGKRYFSLTSMQRLTKEPAPNQVAERVPMRRRLTTSLLDYLMEHRHPQFPPLGKTQTSDTSDSALVALHCCPGLRIWRFPA